MPTARREMAVAADSSGKIYVVDGYDPTTNTSLNILEVYDPATNSWTTRAPVPVARNNPGFAFSPATGKFYLAGGTSSPESLFYNDFYEYNPVTDTWTQRSSFSVERTDTNLVAANGRIYLIGGVTSDGSDPSIVQEYDPVTDTWATKSPLPTPRGFLGVVTAPNGKIYTIGGFLSPQLWLGSINKIGKESLQPGFYQAKITAFFYLASQAKP